MKAFPQSRRSFLWGILAATTGPLVVPSRLFGDAAPSNQICVGIIGVGGHGTNHNLKHYLRRADARVVMACDVDANHLKRSGSL